MASLPARIGVAAVTTAVCILLAREWMESDGPPPVSFTNGGRDLGIGNGKSNVTGRGPWVLEELDEEVAKTLFVMDQPGFVYDPYCYYKYHGGINGRIEWPEHPAGAWHRRTNTPGWREDDNRKLGSAAWSVLVTGDSHTEGICENPESFANRLEAKLEKRLNGSSAVVLNTGAVGYSFYNYLGILSKFEHHKVDVFVVAVYGGNDFLEVLRPHHYLRGTTAPPRQHGYWDKIEAAMEVSSTALAQGLNQVLYFQYHPEQVDVALEAALATAAEIRRVCRERKTRLVYVYIPPAFEASWPELDVMCERAMDVLELSPDDLQIASRLRDRLLTGLDALGIDTIAMGDSYRAADRPCYWKRDLHINLEGHERIATLLDQQLASGAGHLTALAAGPPDGPHIERDGQDRVLAEGHFTAGERSGAWTLYYDGGEQRAAGHYERGMRTGEWNFWYADGKPKKSGFYSGGLEEGVWVESHPGGGERLRATWSAGKLEGTWVQLYADGKTAREGTFSAGREEGIWRAWYVDGQLEYVATMQAGALSGPFEKRHKNGQIAAQGTYQSAQREGAWRYWNPAGQLLPARSGTYLADERVSD